MFLLEMDQEDRDQFIDALVHYSERKPTVAKFLLKEIKALKPYTGLVLVGDGEAPNVTVHTSGIGSSIPVTYQNRETQRRERLDVRHDPSLVERVMRGLAIDRVITSVLDALNSALDDAEALSQQSDTPPEAVHVVLEALSMSTRDALEALSRITGEAESDQGSEGQAIDQPATSRSAGLSRYRPQGE